METIFTYDPAREEFKEIDVTYVGITEEDYMRDIERRAKHRGSTEEYETVADLQHLFKVRGDQQKLNHYTNILNDDLIDVTNKIYNE